MDDPDTSNDGNAREQQGQSSGWWLLDALLSVGELVFWAVAGILRLVGLVIAGIVSSCT